MKQRENQPLKDECLAVINSELASTRKKLSDRIERSANRLLGRQKRSSSIPTLIGGRPESNRSKF